MFNFGKNWQTYSLRLLDQERLTVARKSLVTLLGTENLSGKSFLDVGCGTGIFTIAARQLGASSAIGLDINPLCIEVSCQNAERFAPDVQPGFQIADALDEPTLAALGQFDVVYAWGSLHHTGDMYRAIKNVSECVKPGGTFVLAIYNAHVTSPVWKRIKWFYNQMPAFIQRLMIILFGIVIYIAKFAFTRKNPLKKERAMDFWVDVIDWVGGYPYEYETPEQVETYLAQLNFSHQRTISPVVPTGCNEFIFVKNAGS